MRRQTALGRGNDQIRLVERNLEDSEIISTTETKTGVRRLGQSSVGSESVCILNM